MADRRKHDVQAITRALVPVVAKISILGNTTPANGTFSVAEGTEAVASVARTGVGTYRMTLRDGFVKAIAAHTDIVPHGGGARTVRIDAISASGKTVDFKVLNTSLAAADTPNAQTDIVYVTVMFGNSGVR